MIWDMIRWKKQIDCLVNLLQITKSLLSVQKASIFIIDPALQKELKSFKNNTKQIHFTGGKDLICVF